MKDTLLTPVLAGSVLAFTFLIAAIGAKDAEQPYMKAVAAKPIGHGKEKPMIAAVNATQSAEQRPDQAGQ